MGSSQSSLAWRGVLADPCLSNKQATPSARWETRDEAQSALGGARRDPRSPDLKSHRDQMRPRWPTGCVPGISDSATRSRKRPPRQRSRTSCRSTISPVTARASRHSSRFSPQLALLATARASRHSSRFSPQLALLATARASPQLAREAVFLSRQNVREVLPPRLARGAIGAHGTIHSPASPSCTKHQFLSQKD